MTLLPKIEEWLMGHGYPFEMRVAKLFAESGLKVQQSDYFYDEEISGYRELDIVAGISKDSDTVNYSINFLIECKVCKKYPWVIFKHESDAGGDCRLIMMPGNDLGNKMTGMYMRDKDLCSLPILCNQKSLGYSLVEALRHEDKKDNSYSALITVSKALSSYTQKPKYIHAAGKDICEIFVPVIVVLGELCEAYLNENNEVAIKQAYRSSVHWKNPVCGNRSTIIQIVTHDAVPEFCKEAMNSSQRLLDVVISEGKIDRLAKQAKKPDKSPPSSKTTATKSNRKTAKKLV